MQVEQVAESALLLAVRDRLRLMEGFTDKQVEVEGDEIAPATVGQTFIVVAPGGFQPGPRHRTSHGAIDLTFGVDVVVVKRGTNTPRDRMKNLFLTNLDNLNSELGKVWTQVDFSYDVLEYANATIEHETEVAGAFIEPLRFASMEKRPRVADAQFFGGGQGASGLMRTISFQGARLVRTR